MVISELTRVHNISCLFFNLPFSVKAKLAKAKKLERIITQAVHGDKNVEVWGYWKMKQYVNF